MRTSVTFWFKKLDFSKFVVCPHGQGEGVEPVRTREVNFSRICSDVLYGLPLNLRFNFQGLGLLTTLIA